MTVGSLFSGIGGFDLGLERAGMQIEWQVEIDDYCRAVLGKHWPHVPCHADITTIDWHWIPRVDLVCGGFPCQPFSAAGKRRGADDDRYLWPEVVRCLTVVRPTWFLGENVYGLLHLGIEQMYADLEALGYQVAILGIPACAVDAPHIRKRIWILAHATSDLRGASGHDGSETSHGRGSSVADDPLNGRGSGRPRGFDSGGERERERALQAVADAAQFMRHGGGDGGQTRRDESSDGGANVADSDQQSMGRSTKSWCQRRQWPAESDVGRVAHGIPRRVDRLRGLGNAIVPQIAEALGRMILEVS